MTIQPAVPPHLLTVAEYLEIGEIEFGYAELVEGRLLMSPSPARKHNRAGFVLGLHLERQLPEGLEVVPDLDVDLQLAPPDAPGFVRRPDLIVVERADQGSSRESGLVRASEVLIAVEIVSPGSRRTDYVTKRGEYADAGIPHYWILDLTEPVSLLTCHLAGEFGYADGGTFTGTATIAEPFPVKLDLDALV